LGSRATRTAATNTYRAAGLALQRLEAPQLRPAKKRALNISFIHLQDCPYLSPYWDFDTSLSFWNITFIFAPRAPWSFFSAFQLYIFVTRFPISLSEISSPSRPMISTTCA